MRARVQAEGSWSVGAPSLENFKSNVRSIVDVLRDSLSLTNDNPSAVAQELSSTVSSVAASVAERKDQIVTTGIAHASALASDIGDHVEEGEKAVAQAGAFVRREPLWALAGLGALVTARHDSAEDVCRLKAQRCTSHGLHSHSRVLLYCSANP